MRNAFSLQGLKPKSTSKSTTRSGKSPAKAILYDSEKLQDNLNAQKWKLNARMKNNVISTIVEAKIKQNTGNFMKYKQNNKEMAIFNI